MKASERDEILTKYLTLKAQAADLEGEISLLRETILEKVPSGQYQNLIVCIDEQARESFDWKKAKAALTDAVKQKLAPFVKQTAYRVLKVSKI